MHANVRIPPAPPDHSWRSRDNPSVSVLVAQEVFPGFPVSCTQLARPPHPPPLPWSSEDPACSITMWWGREISQPWYVLTNTERACMILGTHAHPLLSSLFLSLSLSLHELLWVSLLRLEVLDLLDGSVDAVGDLIGSKTEPTRKQQHQQVRASRAKSV